jgi:cell division protein FtsW (lipid II flippase)
MTKLKLTSVAIISALLAASAPNSASAVVRVPVVPGTHFGAGSGPWPIFGCAGGIILAALAANARDNRELTAEEAWSCGTLFLLSQPKMARKEHKHHRHVSHQGYPPISVKG